MCDGMDCGGCDCCCCCCECCCMSFHHDIIEFRPILISPLVDCSCCDSACHSMWKAISDCASSSFSRHYLVLICLSLGLSALSLCPSGGGWSKPSPIGGNGVADGNVTDLEKLVDSQPTGYYPTTEMRLTS